MKKRLFQFMIAVIFVCTLLGTNIECANASTLISENLTFDSGEITAYADFQLVEDTYVPGAFPEANYGSDTNLGISVNRTIYMKFSIDGIPENATITDVRMIMKSTNGSSQTGGIINKLAPDNPYWDESEPTWNNQLSGSIEISNLYDIGPVSKGSAVETGNLAGALNGNGDITFIICSEAEDGAAYASKESGGGPILRVTYTFKDEEAPSQPAGLKVQDVTTNTAAIEWPASTDNVGTAGYYVFRNGSKIADVAGSVFADTDLSPRTNYIYTVKAYDASGNISAEDEGLNGKSGTLY